MQHSANQWEKETDANEIKPRFGTSLVINTRLSLSTASSLVPLRQVRLIILTVFDLSNPLTAQDRLGLRWILNDLHKSPRDSSLVMKLINIAALYCNGKR